MSIDRDYWVYILTNRKQTVLYTGVTNNLLRRIAEHKTVAQGRAKFTAKYNVNILVYFERYSTIHDAIRREKQLKAGPRRQKRELICSMNPKWHDLTGLIIDYYN
ncbi:MAG: GIY-YIG nuclease family protein [Rhodothermales bacterium]|nr:GIY-YIG nuclease family protein [Rhodothermales bacterium]